MQSRSAVMKPARAKTSWIITFFPWPYSSILPLRSDEAAITGATSGVEQAASIACKPNTPL